MVKAVYTKEKMIHTLRVSGHAEYDVYGKDIVCAGVSAIVQALIGWAENHPNTVKCIEIDENTGEVLIICIGGDDVSAVFYMTAVGIGGIASVYPDNVEIKIIGIGD